MELKLMYAGAMFLAGWLWAFFFVRQLLFNLRVAYPLIRSMNGIQEGLIAIGAKRYTHISTGICILISLIALGVIIRFCPLYVIITFFAAALIAIISLFSRIVPENRDMFNSFCGTYYQFVPDDELRTHIFNKKTGIS